jgi:hypothetical protein
MPLGDAIQAEAEVTVNAAIALVTAPAVLVTTAQ